MLVESMAGKAGAMHGKFHEATPFVYDEQNRAVNYFGEQLQKAGYAYYGNETMYSGNSGEVMQASIYIGLVRKPPPPPPPPPFPRPGRAGLRDTSR